MEALTNGDIGHSHGIFALEIEAKWYQSEGLRLSLTPQLAEIDILRPVHRSNHCWFDIGFEENTMSEYSDGSGRSLPSDLVQQEIDRIVSNQGHQYSCATTNMRPMTPSESSPARSTTSCARTTSASKFGPIEIAFDQDTRWHGAHPFNAKPEDLAELEALIPPSYRYARNRQAEVAWIPPPHHPQRSPGSHFILQKRGASAIPIVNPKTLSRAEDAVAGTQKFSTQFEQPGYRQFSNYQANLYEMLQNENGAASGSEMPKLDLSSTISTNNEIAPFGYGASLSEVSIPDGLFAELDPYGSPAYGTYTSSLEYDPSGFETLPPKTDEECMASLARYSP